MTEHWTIDSIAHALPHPDLRAEFARQTNFTEITDLPPILDRWIRLVEDFQAGGERIEALRSHYRENGQLPADYEATLIDMTEQIQADAQRARRGAA